MDYAAIIACAAQDHLEIFGAFHPTEGETLILLGPKEPGFWAYMRSTPEFLDGQSNPIDRWSARVIASIAERLSAKPCLPFTGPPYHPFISWAAKSGRAWPSPVGMLVHDRAGLFVSYRGALLFDCRIDLPDPTNKPCETCVDRPCETACPVNALGVNGYDVDKCRQFLETEDGQDCMQNGCKARRACPISQSYGRLTEQSAHHMRYFHK